MDVGADDFERQVIARSHEMPVIVDFWAPWCGPCRMLGPILERLAQEGAGRWRLVKVNTDEHPSLGILYGVQGIPAVKAFRDGAMVSEFVGAQPEPIVRQFVARLVDNRSVDAYRRGRRAELAGDGEGAATLYEEALRVQPDHAGALVGLGRVRMVQERLDDAVALLGRVPGGTPQRAEADALAARARFRQQAGLTGSEVEARRRVSANPDDLDARLTLSSLLADKGQHREALEAMLAVLERDRGEYGNRARQDMLALFQLLGDGSELTREYRPRLAALLF
jgi:putative thioredoxin